jgi:hypothetical protein
MGFAEAFYAERFGTLGREDLPEARRTRRLVAAQLGREAALAQWRRGASMAMSEAMRLAWQKRPRPCRVEGACRAPRKQVVTPPIAGVLVPRGRPLASVWLMVD